MGYSIPAGNSLPVNPYRATSELEDRTFAEFRKVSEAFARTKARIDALEALISDLEDRLIELEDIDQ